MGYGIDVLIKHETDSFIYLIDAENYADFLEVVEISGVLSENAKTFSVLTIDKSNGKVVKNRYGSVE